MCKPDAEAILVYVGRRGFCGCCQSMWREKLYSRRSYPSAPGKEDKIVSETRSRRPLEISGEPMPPRNVREETQAAFAEACNTPCLSQLRAPATYLRTLPPQHSLRHSLCSGIEYHTRDDVYASPVLEVPICAFGARIPPLSLQGGMETTWVLSRSESRE